MWYPPKEYIQSSIDLCHAATILSQEIKKALNLLVLAARLAGGSQGGTAIYGLYRYVPL